MPHAEPAPSFDPTDWRQALAAWQRAQPPAQPEPASAPISRIPLGWWEAAFADRPTPSERRGHPCGDHQVLTLVAYDITEPKRLVRIAKICEDYGVRVQYSVFECRLEADRFEQFWNHLLGEIDPETDRLAAYKICAACARDLRSAGTQLHIEKYIAYVF